jgi:CheY-like chemotaxis protein
LALQGNLEDLPLLDIIQIVSFSQKTGYLSIEMEGGDGAIIFSAGLVVAAFTASSPPADPRLASLPRDARERAVRARIGFALAQLARLREGAFAFELTEAVPAVVGSRRIRDETLAQGINPQEMLLDLAQGLDEDRAQSAAALEASFAGPEEGALGGEPIVPGDVLASDLETQLAAETAAAAEAPSPPVRRLRPPPSSDRPGTDTRPLPRIDRAWPPEEPAAAPLAPPPAPPTPAHTLLLVDDEPDVRQVLGRHFAAAGFRVVEAGDPEEAAKAAATLRGEGGGFVLVTDLGMPASGGASFHGGFEVVKRLWKMNLRPPVLMMTESLSQTLRLRARQMGIQFFVFKPTLSKLNAPQYEADLSDFAVKLVTDVLPRLAETAAGRPAPLPRKRAAESAPNPGPPAADAARPFEFLKRRLVELRQGGDANQIAILVMKVAREFFERAVLFVVKNEEARGLGGFGLAPREETVSLVAREVAIPLGESSIFHDVALARRGFAGPPPQDRWLGHLMGRIGRFQSRGIVVLPLVAHRDTIALLFGDNPETGRDPAGLEPLEVFVQQAGIALENVFLQRKIETIAEKDRTPLR